MTERSEGISVVAGEEGRLLIIAVSPQRFFKP